MNKQQELLAQKRAGETGLTLNSYSRQRYQDALLATGQIVSWRYTKAELWKLVRASKSAQDWLLETRGW